MENSTGMSKLAGRVGMLFVLVGCLLFFLGIFGAPRILAFVGVIVMAASLVGFFIEEQGNRRASS
ncbi:MAG: hypothetical protein IPO41_01475 [Acidobacteria bacterium]|nr:hypothetical protein [Acidobacteriota bacterium]MBK9527005.1 hypothetical protein [Acidobacteriota bacterium]MBP7475584.1 hypothetical protein [Pyrinomonadaceae bacterium]